MRFRFDSLSFFEKIKEKFQTIALSSLTLLIFLLPGINLVAAMVFVNDKEAHMSFFMLLALYRMVDGANYQKVIFTNILLGLLIEVCQAPLPMRSFDMNDVVADTIGTLFGYFFRMGYDILPKTYLEFSTPSFLFAKSSDTIA